MKAALRSWLVCCCACIAFQAASILRGEDLIYTASFADGTYLTDGRVANWHDTAALPNLNGKNLLDPNAPLRWLVCNTMPLANPPEAFVEFVGGDRFPGRVQEFRHGAENWTERLPPHLLVKPLLPIDLPNKPERSRVGVKLDGLRRVVWQRRRIDRYQPGTLYFLDGRETPFRSLRWSAGAVLMLLKEGTRRVPFGEIAEIHLPQRDGWDAYYDTVAELTPDGTSRLMRASTTHGLVATTSLERLRATAFSGDPSSWYHMLQPAWSLDPIWIQHATIRARRFFLPHEVPLSLIEPTQVAQKSQLGTGWTWQADRNVRGDSLRSGSKQYGWGFGMQAHSELSFVLPTITKSFRAWVGLDEAVGRGGCAKAQVFANAANGQPLWQSTHLIGSAAVVDTGPLALVGPDGGQKTLVLVADSAHADRPAGSDPYDIRDMVDWLEPQLELDLEKLKAELSNRQLKLIPALADWRVSLAPGTKLVVTNRYDPSRPIEEARTRRELITVGGPFVARRSWKVTPEHKYLSLGVFRFGHVSHPSRIEVRINGQLVTDFEAPELKIENRPPSVLLSIEQYSGKEIEVEIAHLPASDQCRVEWRSLETAASTTPTLWSPLKLVELKSASGSKLETQYDGSIVASGDPPAGEVYTIVGDTTLQGITALRFDAIPDPRYPNQGTGRFSDGSMEISDVKLSAGPIEAPEQAMNVPLDQAWADHEIDANFQIRYMIDENPQSGWTTWPKQSEPHVAIFGPRHDIGLPGGTRLTTTFAFNNQQRVAGRFRVSVTTQPRPVAVELPATVLPHKYIGKARVLLDEDESWARIMSGATKMYPVADAYTGRMGMWVEREKRFSERLPDVSIPIRKNPGPGEARYLRWAWKKKGGETIVLEIAHDNQWGQIDTRKFRYQAGPGPDYVGQAVNVDKQLPTEWTVVTRDLAEEFGEFMLTGFALTPNDGEYGVFDHILVAPTIEDLDAARK